MLRLLILTILVTVTSTVLGTPICSVYIFRPVNFGTYSPFSYKSDESTGIIQIKCVGQGRVSYEIILSAGQSGTYFPRKMRHESGGNSELAYNLFTNASRRKIWGDGRNGTKTKRRRKRSPFTKYHVIYGEIPARQTDIKVGTYRDNILITVNY